MSLRVFLHGDTEVARAFIEGAQGLLGRLKVEMSFNSLPQLARTYVLESGEIIRVQSFFGQDTITIESPILEVAEISEEEVEIPFIIRLMFYGSDGHRYYVLWNVDENILLELTDTETGEVIEQPIHKNDLDAKVAGIAKGAYADCEDMQMDEHAPSVDWSETSGGVSSLKTIRLFPFAGHHQPPGAPTMISSSGYVIAIPGAWYGGYKTTLEFSSNPGPGVYTVDGRTYFLTVTWVVQGQWEWEEDIWYAKAVSYDNDLNGFELNLHDIHTNDLYTSTGHGFVDIDYYVSHGKVVYNLPNLEADVRGFCATKTVDVDLHSDESIDHASGRVKGHLYSPFISEPELFYDEEFDTYKTYAPDRPLERWPEDILREIPNFWVDNVSSALTYKGRAIIFEQAVIEKLYEWNGSPFYSADPYYDLKTDPTYDLTGKIWIQKDVKGIEDTDEEGEAAYDYQWNSFTGIDFPAILELVKAHPKHTGQERLYASLLVE
ncbi:hypothetical protein KAR91_88180 [Candidatus Pacearchaeota archaeon]|nr:hypothetical protein [Candidatus Pacearchaeota archaeon]